MSFDPDDDDKRFGRLLDGVFITATIILIVLFYFFIMGCGTNSMKEKDCVFICPDQENIPDGCYCIDSDSNCIQK